MLFDTNVIGNLTKDAEFKAGNQGDFLAFDIAVNLSKTKVQYISCTIGNIEYAQKIAQYLTKGTKVYLNGMPKADAFISKDGAAKSVFRLFVNKVELLGGNQDRQKSQSNNDSFPEVNPNTGEAMEDINDLIPF